MSKNPLLVPSVEELIRTFSDEEFGALLKIHFASFLHYAFLELNPASRLQAHLYIDLIASKLEDCRLGRTRRLIISLPPRYLKSHCASIAFSAWLHGHSPATHIIAASYGQDLADKHAHDTRRLMQSAFYRACFETRIAADKKAVSDYMTNGGGSRMSTSVGGVLTGRGADFIVIDDPLKPEDALSGTRRQAVNDWYNSTLLSRLNDKKKGVIIIIMQRLHQDDLVGHVLGQEAWEVLNLPAIALEPEEYVFETVLGKQIYRRSEGEPLQEERESLAMLENTRSRIGDYNFSSQYQQQPIPEGGAIVKTDWLLTYETLPPEHNIGHILQSWDTAIKPDHMNDFSVCTTWAYADGKYYLLDVLRKRLNYPDLRKTLEAHAKKWKVRTVLIEDKASGSQLIQEFAGVLPFKILAYELPPNRDKTMRVHAQTDLFEAGKVLLPKQATWLSEFRTELTAFPGSKFDDQVDSTMQALDYMRKTFARNLEIWERLGAESIATKPRWL